MTKPKTVKVRAAMVRDAKRALRQWRKASDGDSGDREHDAALDMADILEALVKEAS